jgi:Flp pilus assembly protein TadB
MLVACAMSCFLAVWALFPQPGARRSVQPVTDAAPSPAALSARRSPVERPLLRALVCSSGCAVVGGVVGGWLLVTVGLVAGVGLSWWAGRLETPATARAKEEIARDFPLVLDLLAACVTAGTPVDEALRVVAAAVPGPLGLRLDSAAARMALGADPQAEWRRFEADPQLATLGRTMLRSLGSGAPLARSLTRLADDRRRDRRTAAQLRARNVGVKAAAPLAVCFLPAFMVIGVIPTIAGAFSRLVL